MLDFIFKLDFKNYIRNSFGADFQLFFEELDFLELLN